MLKHLVNVLYVQFAMVSSSWAMLLVIRKSHHQHSLNLYNQLQKMAMLSLTTCRRRWKISAWYGKTTEQVNAGFKGHL